MTNDSTLKGLTIEDKAPIRVLVVEDEFHIRTSLMNFLEDEGFSALSAESAEDALEIIVDTPVDVVVVDIRLPKLDGNSLIIRAHQIRPGMQFLIYTGSVGYKPSQAIECLGVSPEDVFYKPLSDLSVIAEAIHRKFKNRDS